MINEPSCKIIMVHNAGSVTPINYYFQIIVLKVVILSF